MSVNAISEAGLKSKIPALFILFILLFVIFANTSESFHSQLIKGGAKLWPDYVILRVDIALPSCNPNEDVATKLAALELASTVEAEDDLFAVEFDRDATRRSIVKQNALCATKHEIAIKNQAQMNDGIRAYRFVETSFAKLVIFSLNSQRVILLTLIFIAGLVSTLKVHHIAFRAIESKLDYNLSITAQMVGNTVLTISTISYQKSVTAAKVPIENPEIILLMILGFGFLACVNAYQLIKKPAALKEGGTISHAFLSVPLYVYMIAGAGSYFVTQENHIAALSIYFASAFDIAGILVSIALYIWVGMLLKQTRIGELVFAVFKPWKLPPELLAFVAILIMAVPTAYTGGSGIVILALGVVVYEELRRVGTRRQLALAATAMTGSSGVVLRPCILVLLIAMLNKEVVTDELYYWGIRVFFLTLASFFFFVFITKKEPLKMASPTQAWGPIKEAFKPLFPYVIVIGVVVLFYAIFLKAYIDEFSAPIILPMIIIAVIIYERTKGLKNYDFKDDERPADIKGALEKSIDGAVVHIGALLFIMGCGLAAGGCIQRSGIFSHIPETFSSIWIAMTFIVALLVLIGMTMDAMAAVVMISGSLAVIAYKNGIDPIHFWMTALVALELGFLSPPVALNHLFTRQVVGEEEAKLAALEGDTFWYRHEKMLLPIVVMGTALIIVAYGPLIVGYTN